MKKTQVNMLLSNGYIQTGTVKKKLKKLKGFSFPDDYPSEEPHIAVFVVEDDGDDEKEDVKDEEKLKSFI